MQQFVGYTSVKHLPNGMLELIKCTDFSHLACTYEAYDLATRQRTMAPRYQVFVVTHQEGKVLHG